MGPESGEGLLRCRVCCCPPTTIILLRAKSTNSGLGGRTLPPDFRLCCQQLLPAAPEGIVGLERGRRGTHDYC